LEVSDIECRRAGLGDLKRCWIVVDEYNYDVAERSWYIGPDGKTLGRFSKTFMMKISLRGGVAQIGSPRQPNRVGRRWSSAIAFSIQRWVLTSQLSAILKGGS
jgi:hypothetical protein